jgi:hypothetical protein
MSARWRLTALLPLAGLFVAIWQAPVDASTGGPHSAGIGCRYRVEKKFIRRVLMSEVHGWIGVDATFRYAAGNAADTYVGVAVQAPGGKWSASGTDHVTKTKEFGQTATQSGRGNRRVTGNFRFHVLKWGGTNCEKVDHVRFTRAVRFEGGMRVSTAKVPAPKGLSGQCDRAPGHQVLYPNTSVFTSTGKSLAFDRAFTLFGVTLGSSTTFSTNAQIELRNRGKLRVWVCGLSATGQAVPIADAAMLYAGPRISDKQPRG